MRLISTHQSNMHSPTCTVTSQVFSHVHLRLSNPNQGPHTHSSHSVVLGPIKASSQKYSNCINRLRVQLGSCRALAHSGRFRPACGFSVCILRQNDQQRSLCTRSLALALSACAACLRAPTLVHILSAQLIAVPLHAWPASLSANLTTLGRACNRSLHLGSGWCICLTSRIKTNDANRTHGESTLIFDPRQPFSSFEGTRLTKIKHEDKDYNIKPVHSYSE